MTSSALQAVPSCAWAELTISDAARHASVGAHTLRYYVRAGLLARVERALAQMAVVQESLDRIDFKIAYYKEKRA